MEKIIFWALAAYGMSTIIVYGSIFESIRTKIHLWGDNEYSPTQSIGKFISGLISCMLCTSTWVGFFMSIIFGGLSTKIFDMDPTLSIFFDGMLTAGAVWAINSIVEFFEESRINK